jgi:FixJ family two-component response regulator
MWLIVSGCTNKQVAARLGITYGRWRTYRAWALERMRTRTFADLVRISIDLKERLDREGAGSGER